MSVVTASIPGMDERDQRDDWTGFLRCWSAEWADAQASEDAAHLGADGATALRHLADSLDGLAYRPGRSGRR